jgi:hypothetical protein
MSIFMYQWTTSSIPARGDRLSRSALTEVEFCARAPAAATTRRRDETRIVIDKMPWIRVNGLWYSERMRYVKSGCLRWL